MSRALTVTVRGSQGSGKTALLKLLSWALARPHDKAYGRLERIQNDVCREDASIFIDDPVLLAMAVDKVIIENGQGALIDRERQFELALKLVCDWADIDPERGNTVIALAVRDLLAGQKNSLRIDSARDLVRRKMEARQPGRRIAP